MDVTAAQINQANFAAAKLAHRAFAPQIKLTGPDFGRGARFTA